jgi:DNA polymerase alpha subunit B
LPNPCTFSVNEILIAATSVDVLFHLRKEELFTRAEEAVSSGEPEAKDPMANLVRHVLGQRSFYPLFPPPEQHAAEVNLDVTHYPLLKMDGPAPDIFITPSKLKHFSKVSSCSVYRTENGADGQIVDSTLVVNPAHVSRAHSAGTYAKITVHPTPKAKLEKGMEVDGLDGDFREHDIWERARSDIWRI